MITGFNTDIMHAGITYHVQTEDKGFDNPILLSLVYVGGAILASKRTPYGDLIKEGFAEKTLTDRLQRQHKLICAAIRAGRIEDLKHMSDRDAVAQPEAEKAAPQKPARPENAAPQKSTRPAARKSARAVAQPVAQPIAPPVVEEVSVKQDSPSKPAQAPSILDLLTDSSEPIIPEGIEIRNTWLNDVEPEVAAPDAASAADEGLETFASGLEDDIEDLYLSLLDDEGDFRAGQLATIKIYVGRGTYGRYAVADASVTVKVLGTTFRPLIVSAQTDPDGIAVVRALLPVFTSGRAALLIRASDVNGDAIEMRRIIHQA